MGRVSSPTAAATITMHRVHSVVAVGCILLVSRSVLISGQLSLGQQQQQAVVNEDPRIRAKMPTTSVVERSTTANSNNKPTRWFTASTSNEQPLAMATDLAGSTILDYQQAVVHASQWTRSQPIQTDHCIGSPKNLSFCRAKLGWAPILGLPNFLGHQTEPELVEALATLAPLEALTNVKCRQSNQLKLLLCSLVSPVCLDVVLPPCRDLCQTVRASCEPALRRQGIEWPKFLDCRRLPFRATIQGGNCISRQPALIVTSNRESSNSNKVRHDELTGIEALAGQQVLSSQTALTTTTMATQGNVTNGKRKRKRKEKKDKAAAGGNSTTTTTTPPKFSSVADTAHDDKTSLDNQAAIKSSSVGASDLQESTAGITTKLVETQASRNMVVAPTEVAAVGAEVRAGTRATSTTGAATTQSPITIEFPAPPSSTVVATNTSVSISTSFVANISTTVLPLAVTDSLPAQSLSPSPPSSSSAAAANDEPTTAAMTTLTQGVAAETAGSLTTAGVTAAEEHRRQQLDKLQVQAQVQTLKQQPQLPPPVQALDDLGQLICSVSPEWLIKTKISDSQLMSATTKGKLKVRSFRLIFGSIGASTRGGASSANAPSSLPSSNSLNSNEQQLLQRSRNISTNSLYLTLSNTTVFVAAMGSSVYMYPISDALPRAGESTPSPTSGDGKTVRYYLIAGSGSTTTTTTTAGTDTIATTAANSSGSGSVATRQTSMFIVWPSNTRAGTDLDSQGGSNIIKAYREFKRKGLEACTEQAARQQQQAPLDNDTNKITTATYNINNDSKSMTTTPGTAVQQYQQQTNATGRARKSKKKRVHTVISE